MPDWTTLVALRPGAVFETRDGVRAVKSEYFDLGRCEHILLASGKHVSNLMHATPVREIDVAALEEENHQMALLVHDRRCDYEHWIEYGAVREREACVKIAERAQREDTFTPSIIALYLRARGPILPPLPPDRLAAENAALRELLAKLEWKGGDVNDIPCVCPCCRSEECYDDEALNRHRPGCELAAALGRVTVEAPA